MKLSVKWLAGLAVLVLAVVAVVGTTSATKAQTVDGSIFVVNEWSTITNESPAPTGRVFRSSVYATIADGTRLIQSNADLVRVVVKDADLDVATTASDTTVEVDDAQNGEGGGDDAIFDAVAGQTRTIFLTGQGSTPIAGDLSNIKIFDSAGTPVDRVADGTFTVQSAPFFAGSAGNSPWITVTRNTGAAAITISSVEYETSAVDIVVVTVKSELETVGITVTAEETGLSTGIFAGFVRLIPTTGTTTAGTAPTLDGTPEPGTAGLIRTSVGPVTVSFDDNGVTRQTTALVDTSAPSSSISGPANGSATQNRTPTFSGTISESGSGLDISNINVAYDNNNDATNTTPVANTTAGGTGALAGGAVSLSISTSGAVDGDTAFSFSQIPSAQIPVGPGLANPDHIVDWVIRAVDLAGNIGLSDADASTAGVQLPTVKIDTVIPTFSTTASEHKTGLATSASGETSARNTLRVVFNDQVANVQTSDFTVTLDSGAVVVPTAVTVVNNPTTPAGFSGRALVYLTFANDLVSNDTPLVALQDTISDLAGNFTSTGSREVGDGIAPALTITLSGGTGTGTNGEGPSGLTNNDIEINIVTDEPLSGAPAVTVFPDGGASEAVPTALAQGANSWTATYVAPGSPADGTRAIQVVATDTAANVETVGGNDASVSGTPNFVLDTSLATPTLTVGGGSSTTDQTRPSIVINFAAGGEVSTVNLTTVQLDGTDITSDVVASSDGLRFFYIPPSDLSLGDHDLLIEAGDAADAAANENTSDIELTITIQERSTFNVDMFAGWNAISFPSDPIDPDINSVFDNAGHDAALGFNPNVPGGWVVAVRDTVSGLLEPATENGLTTIRTTQAYFVHSLNFEQVTVLLIGEVLPASGSPPGIVTIPTVLGFNAVPIVDTSRKLTTGDAGVTLTRPVPGGGTSAVTVATYLGAVVEGRVYRYNPEILAFELLSGSTVVRTGDVLFVEVTGTPVPIFP